MSEQSDLARTLRRIPKDILLSMATREIIPSVASYCLVGWAVRESLAYANGKGTEEYSLEDARKFAWLYPETDPQIAARLFGGTREEWRDIYIGVDDSRFPLVEAAFVQVLQEALR